MIIRPVYSRHSFTLCLFKLIKSIQMDCTYLFRSFKHIHYSVIFWKSLTFQFNDLFLFIIYIEQPDLVTPRVFSSVEEQDPGFSFPKRIRELNSYCIILTFNLFLKLIQLHLVSVDIDEQHCILEGINFRLLGKRSIHNDLQSMVTFVWSNSKFHEARLLFLACGDLRYTGSTPRSRVELVLGLPPWVN